mmetsp:Transcript_112702/g.349814  ORF Transcript_112702/g.349814 Transcript_112702/m.349814 type:complete len:201 (-) Transcript_112702:927-1529(-)
MRPSPDVSASRTMSSISAASKVSPRTQRSSSGEMRPLLSRSKRMKVWRSTCSCACTWPAMVAARNSVYSISVSPAASRPANSVVASAPSTQKFSSRRPLSSLSVMVPRFCVSMRRNCSRSSAWSSVDRDQAIIQSTVRRKCDAREKLCKLERMSGSMRTPAAWCRLRIQACSRAACAVRRCAGLRTRSSFTNCCAVVESL